MKKIIAFITAFAALGCTVTACGKSSGNSSSDTPVSSSASSAADGNEAETGTGEQSSANTVSTEKTTEEKQQMSTDPDDDPEVIEVTDADYMDALQDMIDCLNDGDYLSYAKYMFPEKLLDYAAKKSGSSLEELAKQMEQGMGSVSADKNLPIKLGKVVEAEGGNDDINELTDTLEKLFEEMKSATSEEIENEFGFDLREYLSGISDLHYISVEMINAQGDTDTNDFVAFYLDGEGWKFDVSMLSYVKKSKKSSANMTASSLHKAVSAALTDMDENGKNVSGKFIIGSTASLEHNIPSGFDTDELKKGIKEYFSPVGEVEYFAVCENGECTYTACQYTDGKYYGSYPADYKYGTDGPEPDDDSLDFSALYSLCIQNLK